jgi:hypothetical protein
MTSVRLRSSPRTRKALSTSQARSTVCDSLRSPRRVAVCGAASAAASEEVFEVRRAGVVEGLMIAEFEILFSGMHKGVFIPNCGLTRARAVYLVSPTTVPIQDSSDTGPHRHHEIHAAWLPEQPVYRG